MGDIDVDAPFDPQVIPGDKSVITRFCENPISGRIEWVEAKVRHHFLGTGTEITQDVKDYVLEGDTKKGDTPCMIIANSLGGDGDATYNVFAMGSAFDKEAFKNETESMVYHYVKDTQQVAVIRVKFHFRNTETVRPYKVLYVVELGSGDTIENELMNV